MAALLHVEKVISQSNSAKPLVLESSYTGSGFINGQKEFLQLIDFIW